jgi:membrane-associated phospholipid phosphatase
VIACLALAALLGAPVPDAALPQPLEVYRLKLAVDVPIIVAGGIATVAARFFLKDQLTRMSCPCDRAGINVIDRGAVGNDSHFAGTASDITVVAAIAAPPLLDLLDLGANRALGEDLIVFAETMAVNASLEQVVNFASSRPRPRTYLNDPAYTTTADAYLSFYSGHVAYTFAALSMASTTLRLRYGEQVWPWIVTGAVGGSMAVERVLAGSHFPTDVATGALVGTALGIAIPWLHARPGMKQLSIQPTDGGRGLAVAGAF